MSTFQKSDSWHAERAKGIGGSEIAAILGISPYTTAYELWLEKTGKKPRMDISHLPHVQRGILGEDVCRMMLERSQLKSYKPKTWQGLKPWHRCSDDGWNLDDNVILEIKCMGSQNHQLASEGIVPDYYACQVQWNLFVSKASKCLFISFKPEDESMHIVEVLPKIDEQKKIEEAVDFFWLSNVQADIPPALKEKDYVRIADKKLEETLAEYERLQKESKAIEGQIEALKESVREYVKNHPAISTPSGYRISLSSRKGGVDYAKYCGDKGITPEELKAYEKKPVEVFSIKKSASFFAP